MHPWRLSRETWGEAAPGEPFYLFGENGDLKLDIGIADSRNSFGELSPRHLDASRALRDRFLSRYTDAELAPRIEALA